jgi:hypothetical protein
MTLQVLDGPNFDNSANTAVGTLGTLEETNNFLVDRTKM